MADTLRPVGADSPFRQDFAELSRASQGPFATRRNAGPDRAGETREGERNRQSRETSEPKDARETDRRRESSLTGQIIDFFA